MPVLASARRRHALGIEHPFYAVYGGPCHGGHPEDALDHGHRVLINLVTVASAIVPEPVVGPTTRYKLPLTGLAEFSPPSPLRDLRRFVLGQLVEDAVRELPFWGIVAMVVQRLQPAIMVFKLALQQVMVSGFAGEAIPVLGKHHRDTTAGYQVPDAIHAGPLEAGATLGGIGDFFLDLIAATSGVITQSLELLCQRVAAPDLLLGGDASVEKCPLGAIAGSVVHLSLPTSALGSTRKASASLRMVEGWTSAKPFSILHTVPWASPAILAKSLWERTLSSLSRVNFSTSTSIVRKIHRCFILVNIIT